MQVFLSNSNAESNYNHEFLRHFIVDLWWGWKMYNYEELSYFHEIPNPLKLKALYVIQNCGAIIVSR